MVARSKPSRSHLGEWAKVASGPHWEGNSARESARLKTVWSRIQIPPFPFIFILFLRFLIMKKISIVLLFILLISTAIALPVSGVFIDEIKPELNGKNLIINILISSNETEGQKIVLIKISSSDFQSMSKTIIIEALDKKTIPFIIENFNKTETAVVVTIEYNENTDSKTAIIELNKLGENSTYKLFGIVLFSLVCTFLLVMLVYKHLFKPVNSEKIGRNYERRIKERKMNKSIIILSNQDKENKIIPVKKKKKKQETKEKRQKRNRRKR